jgi:ATP-binding cassette subfamily D (ALD) protein 3
LDLILFSRKLSELVGWEGPCLIIGWYFLSGIIIRIISPPFGKLIAFEQKLEGEYRSVHNDLLVHSEEVAFYKGEDWEKRQINKKFKDLKDHFTKVLYRRF